jgi:hypothetical protein
MVNARFRNMLILGMGLLVAGAIFPFMLINALPGYANNLPSSYGGACQVCHVSSSGGEALNSFGTDYSEHDNDIDAISKLDSDDDGHSNEKELKAGTFPGDPDSSPQGIPGFPYESMILGITIVMLLFARAGIRRF